MADSRRDTPQAAASASVEISVVIATYNRVEHLKRCLEALRNQTLEKEKYEIIVVDDGSRDGTVAFLQNLRWPDGPAFRYVLGSHRGPAGARNIGVRQARGRIVTFLDDDTIAEAQLLEKVLQTFRNNEDLVCLGATIVPVLRNRLLSPMNGLFSWKSAGDAGLEVVGGDRGLVGLRAFSTCHLHVDKSTFDALNGFDESLRIGEDMDFIFRLIRSGYRAAVRRDLLVYHYERDDFGSITRRWFKFGLNDPRIVQRYFGRSLCVEVDAFHGRLKYVFFRKSFPVSVYLLINNFTVLSILAIAALLKPLLGGGGLLFVLGGLFLTQRKPLATAAFLLYTIVSQAAYHAGAVVGSWRHRALLV